jgi:hypothetical protein
MNTCNECEHHTPPAVLDAGHPCMHCHGDRVVFNGSNFKARALRVIGSVCNAAAESLDSYGMRTVHDADPDPYCNTVEHARVETD